MLDFQKLKSIITDNNSFLITTHVNPDADAIGSELALAYILKDLGKKVFIINHSATPYYLEFLDELKLIQKYDAQKHDDSIDRVEVVFYLDLNQFDRVRSLTKAVTNTKKVSVCIDHHLDPENFVDYSFIDKSYSSTGEIIYDFIKETRIVELNKDIAVALYAAIMTDTGSFRFDRTTAKIHRTVADLLDAGVNPTEVYDKIYDQSRFSKIRLLGEAINTIKLDDTEEIGYMVVTQEALNKMGADETEVDGFVNYCLSIEKVRIGILFFELRNGVKISFRSKGNIPIYKLAEEYGGGGHLNAAGARIFDVELDQIIKKVIDSARKYLHYL